MSLTDDDKKWIEERLTERLTSMKEELIEQMRAMQTELLRGFNAFSEGFAIRMSKVEADERNLDAALSRRVDVVERRLMEIEQRLHIQPPDSRS